MWLPSPLYERAPQYWLLIGLFLIAVGTYLGLEVAPWYMFAGVFLGGASCGWGARTFWQRALMREQAEKSAGKA